MARISAHTVLLTFCGCLLACGLLTAAGLRSSLISETDAQRIGLERAWFTRVSIDSAKGEIKHITQHVNATKSYTVFEVRFDGGVKYLSEHDVDGTGEAIGKERAQQLAERLVDDLDRAELNPKLSTMTIPVVTLYVATDRGVIQAIDGQNGRTRWVSQVGRASRYVEAPGANDRYVAVVSGGNLYVLDADDGKQVWHRQLKGVAAAGPALSNQLLFVPLLDSTIVTYELSNQQEAPWTFRSAGRTLTQPTYTGDVVTWPTDRGHVYIAQSDVKNLLFQVDTNNAIVASIAALPPNRLLTAAVSGYLYCLDEEEGKVLWRFSTGDRVNVAPVVVGNAIYVVTESGKLFRVSSAGVEEWPRWVDGIDKLLSATEARLYCVTKTGTLAVIDAVTGRRLQTMRSAVPDLQIYNRQTDRVFLGSRDGLIQCLRESGRQWPAIHVDLAEAAPAEPPPQQQPQEDPAASEEQPPGEADPFGTPADADPFGSSPATADPFGTGADPFGTGGGDSGAPVTDPFADPF